MALPGDVDLTVKLPEPTVAEVWGSAENVRRDILERVVLSLFAEGRLSAGKAAELLGLPYRDFMQLLVQRKIPWPYDLEDLKDDLAEVERVMRGEYSQ
jgi:predicted HTH domain antitoxin